MKTNALTLMSLILRTDSYKFSQWLQLPEDTTNLTSYIESRGGETESVFFGLQAFIKDYLLDPITMADIDRAEKYAKLGTSIRYLGVNGYDSDREYANKYLSVDSIYTVKQTNVDNWSSSVELLEFPDKLFNTVMFSEVL